jgi:23S rRNA (adenine2503-C2)-methyltransferase
MGRMHPAPDPLALTSVAFVEAAKANGIARGVALEAYRAVHRRGEWLPWMAPPPPAPARELIDGKTVKFLLPVDGDYETESVVIPMPHRTGWFSRTLCVSSQVGCAMGCRFCETAQMGLLRHLTVREIVQQVHTAIFRVTNPWDDEPATLTSGRSPAPALIGEGETNPRGPGRGFPIKNLVFMGMGEPMDNIEAVLGAIRIIADKNGPGLAPRHITISTVGRTDGIRRLGEFIGERGFHQVQLAVSLNAPNDAVRSEIMPINRAEPMAKLRQSMVEFPKRPSAALCVEYVLIPGVNDSLDQCDEVCAFLKGMRASLNVIPYNPRRNSPWPAPTDESVDAFVNRAVANGQFTKIRGTKGRSAMAACGQLGNERIRARKRVEGECGSDGCGTGDPRPASGPVDLTIRGG